MIGTIVNTAAILVGSLVGGLFQKGMTERINTTLFVAMGFSAFGLGINSMVQNMPSSQFPVLFIVSLALGGALGTALDLDGRVARLTQKKGDGGKLGQGLVTGCLLFCIGTLSILGPVQSALYEDHTFLFTNATLDLVTSMVLASTYGIGMVLSAGILFCWQGSIYGLTMLVGDFITDTMMCEVGIVGGVLIAMSGLGMLEIKNCKPLNFLPALVIPPIWCLVYSTL